MKKRTILMIVCAILMCSSLTACDSDASIYFTDPPVNGEALELSNFKTVDGKDYLVYDDDTRVVYYMIFTARAYSGYGYLAPYISENGNYCRYVDDEIVEIGVDIDTNN